MKRRITAAILAAVMMLTLGGCSGTGRTKDAGSSHEENAGSQVIENMSFDEMKEAAKGTTVTFYGWGGDEKLNQWLDDVFAPGMKEKYDITMERVPMDIDQVLSQLTGEIQSQQLQFPT